MTPLGARSSTRVTLLFRGQIRESFPRLADEEVVKRERAPPKSFHPLSNPVNFLHRKQRGDGEEKKSSNFQKTPVVDLLPKKI